MSGFDPAEHTVAEVTEYLDAHPDERATVLEVEAAGKNRSSLAALGTGEVTGTTSRLAGLEVGDPAERPGLHNTDPVPESERFGHTAPAETT